MISLIRARFILVASAIIIGFMAGPNGVAEITLGESVYQNTTISPSDSYSDPNQSSHYLVETCNGFDPYSNFADTTGKPYESDGLIVRFKTSDTTPLVESVTEEGLHSLAFASVEYDFSSEGVLG